MSHNSNITSPLTLTRHPVLPNRYTGNSNSPDQFYPQTHAQDSDPQRSAQQQPASRPSSCSAVSGRNEGRSPRQSSRRSRRGARSTQCGIAVHPSLGRLGALDGVSMMVCGSTSRRGWLTDGIACCPGHKGRCYYRCLLGLAGDVTGDH